MSGWLSDVVGGPREAHHVGSADEYRTWVLKLRARLAPQQPGLRESTTPLPAYVSHGRWVVQCPCGNCPSASREWGIAVCVECGVVHPCDFSERADTVEAILLARPGVLHRDFFPTEAIARKHGEPEAHSVLGLARKNRQEGDPATRRVVPKGGG